MKKTLINPPGTEASYQNFHFSTAVRAGDTIWVSGQVGLDANRQPGKDMAEQSQLAFENLKRALEAAGATLADVVELTTFYTDLRGEMRDFMRVKDAFFPDNYPAWTAVGVTQLAGAAFKVENRAVAVAGSSAGG